MKKLLIVLFTIMGIFGVAFSATGEDYLRNYQRINIGLGGGFNPVYLSQSIFKGNISMLFNYEIKPKPDMNFYLNTICQFSVSFINQVPQTESLSGLNTKNLVAYAETSIIALAGIGITFGFLDGLLTTAVMAYSEATILYERIVNSAYDINIAHTQFVFLDNYSYGLFLMHRFPLFDWLSLYVNAYIPIESFPNYILTDSLLNGGISISF